MTTKSFKKSPKKLDIGSFCPPGKRKSITSISNCLNHRYPIGYLWSQRSNVSQTRLDIDRIRDVPSGEASEAVPYLWKSNKVEIKY